LETAYSLPLDGGTQAKPPCERRQLNSATRYCRWRLSPAWASSLASFSSQDGKGFLKYPWVLRSELNKSHNNRSRASTLCHGENGRSGGDRSIRERHTRTLKKPYPAIPTLNSFTSVEVEVRTDTRASDFCSRYTLSSTPVPITPLAEIQDCDCLRRPLLGNQSMSNRRCR
jgi:hypothetical protein